MFLVDGGVVFVVSDVNVWVSVIVLVIFLIVVVYLFFYRLFSIVGVINVVLVMFLVFFVLIFLGVVVLGEEFLFCYGFGMVLIVLGLLVMDG